MHRVVRVNAGGRIFHTYLSTLRRFPNTTFAKLFDGIAEAGHVEAHTDSDVFLDVCPEVFDRVLRFMRTNQAQLPSNDDALRADVVHHLSTWGLLPHAFPASNAEEANQDAEAEKEEGDDAKYGVVELPNVCVVQICDHLSHEQGVKRHAMTITFGADGFVLRRLTQRIRKDLNQQLSSTYWQCYQTNERAAFFATTKIANGAADLLTTSITQNVVQHTEEMGYRLASSYVTLSPDVVHTSVRMLIHNFIFRRQQLNSLEQGDLAAIGGSGSLDDAMEEVETYANMEPRSVGPQRSAWEDSPSQPPAEERVRSRLPTIN